MQFAEFFKSIYKTEQAKEQARNQARKPHPKENQPKEKQQPTSSSPPWSKLKQPMQIKRLVQYSNAHDEWKSQKYVLIQKLKQRKLTVEYKDGQIVSLAIKE